MQKHVKWLRISYWAGAVIDLLAALQMLAPQVMAVTSRWENFQPGADYRFAMGMGAPLMLGWTVLLLWADRDPVARKGILPITVFPVIVGIALNYGWAVRAGLVAVGVVLPLWLSQTVLTGLFLTSYALNTPLKDRPLAALTTPAAPEHAPEPSGGYPVHMIRPTLEAIPHVPFPDGFRIRPLRPDEGGLWLDIQRDAEPYFPIADDLFDSQFGYDPPAIPQRCYFVVDERGVAVGTISAWYNRDFKGGEWGQIHWVALRRAYQGKGLARPMLSHALTQMAQWHGRAFLGTSTQRLPAIKLYLDFGFVPDLDDPGAAEAWRTVAEELKHPALAGLGL